jgi:hypothetical protein
VVDQFCRRFSRFVNGRATPWRREVRARLGAAGVGQRRSDLGGPENGGVVVQCGGACQAVRRPIASFRLDEPVGGGLAWAERVAKQWPPAASTVPVAITARCRSRPCKWRAMVGSHIKLCDYLVPGKTAACRNDATGRRPKAPARPGRDWRDSEISIFRTASGTASAFSRKGSSARSRPPGRTPTVALPDPIDGAGELHHLGPPTAITSATAATHHRSPQPCRSSD